MLARFFIDRPIFAWVISLAVLVLGGTAATFLPVAEYPDIIPPTIVVSCTYPGANAQVVADTVAAPIEQQVNGVENMLYMSSQSANDGSYALTVTFAIGTDVNRAQILVENRLAQALPLLPSQVQQQGVVAQRRSPTALLAVHLIAPDGRYDEEFLSNYATIQVRDELLRVKGVGDIVILGERDYSMRVWLDPNQLATRRLTVVDVVKAVRAQNVQVAAGQVGQQPVPPGQQLQLPISALGRLESVKQFGDIIVKAGAGNGPAPAGEQNPSGPVAPPVVRVRDVARIELGALNYDISSRLDGEPAAGLAVFQLPGSNALELSDAIHRRMEELKPRFPPGLEYRIAFDSTPFIRHSVEEVFRTLVTAVLLVALVVLVFLQDWRAVILPMIDVVVSLVGTFAVLAALGFSLNNLTLFGLVLAIGIVVDDAIVVLENIERLIATGLDPRTATLRAMEEITGPIIAITLVLGAVFLPTLFIPGLTGQFYRQFAVTISAALIISALNAMTLTPSRAVWVFGRGQKSEVGGRRSEVGGQRSEVGGQKSEVGGQRSEVGGQRSEVGGQRSEVGDHKFGGALTSDLRPLTSGKEVLPWWIFAIAGGLLAARLAQQVLPGRWGFPANPGDVPWWRYGAALAAALVGGAVAGGAVGWFIIGPVNAVLRWFFGKFNRFFERVAAAYGWVIAKLLRLSVVVGMVYLGLLVLTYWTTARAPTGFIPTQDQGYLLVNVMLPDAASVQRTQEIMLKIDRIARDIPGVAHTIAVSGQSFVLGTNASNLGSMFVVLEPFSRRLAHDKYDAVIADKLERACLREVEGAVVAVLRAPPVRGLANAGGFQLQTEQRGYVDFDELQTQTDDLIRRANADPRFRGVFTLFRAASPQLYVDIDRAKAEALQVPIEDVFATLQVYMGATYVNQFNRFGRTWWVAAEAAPRFRTSPAVVSRLQVRNALGQMVPLGTLLRVRNSNGPMMVMRYNMYASAAVNGRPAPGVSSGDVVAAMPRLAEEAGVTFDWTGITYLQVRAGSVGLVVFGLGTVMVYLVLAAKYESWRLPLAVILVVPLCILAAVTGMFVAHLPVGIFVQIGLLVLVGLASKNAVLVVEFARQLRAAGRDPREAALEASLIRFRPIIMTSLAFIFGVLPMVVATGAGAEMRRSLGTAVFSGMIGVTLFGIFLTPVFFFILMRLGGRARSRPGPVPDLVGAGADQRPGPPPGPGDRPRPDGGPFALGREGKGEP